MQVIETVSIDDVFPLEDEYGNDLARRDYTLKANKEYVRRLADSFPFRVGSRGTAAFWFTARPQG